MLFIFQKTIASKLQFLVIYTFYQVVTSQNNSIADLCCNSTVHVKLEIQIRMHAVDNLI